MSYLRVRNWEKFQHYHNRPNPPHWIKVYPSLLQDYAFRQLSEVDRARLMGLWLLAGQLRNRIPNDAKYVASVLGAKRVDLETFVNQGWLELVDEDETLSRPISRPALDTEQNRTEDIEKSRTEDDPAVETLDPREHSIVRLLLALKDADQGTEMQIRTRIAQYNLSQAVIEEAREAALSESARSPCAVAMSVLKARGEAA